MSNLETDFKISNNILFLFDTFATPFAENLHKFITKHLQITYVRNSRQVRTRSVAFSSAEQSDVSPN